MSQEASCRLFLCYLHSFRSHHAVLCNADNLYHDLANLHNLQAEPLSFRLSGNLISQHFSLAQSQYLQEIILTDPVNHCEDEGETKIIASGSPVNMVFDQRLYCLLCKFLR